MTLMRISILDPARLLSLLRQDVPRLSKPFGYPTVKSSSVVKKGDAARQIVHESSSTVACHDWLTQANRTTSVVSKGKPQFRLKLRRIVLMPADGREKGHGESN